MPGVAVLPHGIAANTDLELYPRLNTELVSLLDHFTNLVRATREGAEGGASNATANGTQAREALLLLPPGHTCNLLLCAATKMTRAIICTN